METIKTLSFKYAMNVSESKRSELSCFFLKKKKNVQSFGAIVKSKYPSHLN